MQPGKRLVGKVAIVTGGASGIGAETARMFAQHGAKVLLTDSNSALGKSVANEISESGGTAMFATQDVCDEERWAAIVADTEKSHGRLDILCNIAGISGRDPKLNIQTSVTAGPRLAEQTLAQWNRVMEINSTGVFLGTKAAIPAMQRAGGGSIINISSICGIIGSHANAAYHASKGAVRIFSKAAAIQYAPDKIRVNSVHPGFVDTPMTKPGHSNPDVAKQRLAATPLGRFGTPADIAAGCLYLASDLSEVPFHRATSGKKCERAGDSYGSEDCDSGRSHPGAYASPGKGAGVRQPTITRGMWQRVQCSSSIW